MRKFRQLGQVPSTRLLKHSQLRACIFNVMKWKGRGVPVDRERYRAEVVQAPRITISARAGGELDQPPFAIIPPAPDLPATLAAFSGVWEGKWGGVLRSRLIRGAGESGDSSRNLRVGQ
jgi:hypothetical protein